MTCKTLDHREILEPLGLGRAHRATETWSRTLATFAAFALVASGTQVHAGQSSDPVAIDAGLVSGIETDGVRAFKAIPYAAPPVGELRWAPPQSAVPWDGVRSALEYGAQCPQPPTSSTPTREAEDCLFVNVWTGAASDERRPVMVWIHGGGFRDGAASNRAYDGTALAAKGIVLVSFNYRLGPLGFLAHAELTAESPHGASGNYGLLDQIAALRWVRDNIAAFGGDPGRVTIFGESAGASSVSALMASPLAAGLFHGAIAQSGGSLDAMTHLDAAEAAGAAFADALGARSIAELRALPAPRIIAALGEDTPEVDAFRPIVDGRVLEAEIRTILAEGRHNDVPLVLGFNADEMTTLVDPREIPGSLEAYRAWVAARFGELADEFYGVYRARIEDLPRTWLDAQRDLSFGVEMRRWARLASAGESPVWFYYFTHVPPIRNREFYGAHHGAEIVYAFDNLGRVGRDFAPAEYTLATTMSDYWTGFAADGTPNGPGRPLWLAFHRDAEAYLEIGDPIRVGRDLLRDKLDFMERVLAR